MLKHTSRLLLLFITIIITQSMSAPMWGDTMSVKQPDGSIVQVKVFGDEFYRRIESLDGYTLVKDKNTNWICYAELTEDSSDFISTGEAYSKKSNNKAAKTPLSRTKEKKLKKNLKISHKARKAIIEERKRILPQFNDAGTEDDIQNSISYAPTASAAPNIGTITGITILIDFPDDTATVSIEEIDNMLNQTGYSNHYNAGSLKDYYQDISEGQLTYTNIVTEYFRAPYPKTYYNEDLGNKLRVHDLFKAALLDLDAKGFDFSVLSTDENNYVRGLNFYYAGGRDVPWAVGLWPHMSGLSQDHQVTLDGVHFYLYQVTNISNYPTIGTFAHENGHLLFRWGDTYDYDNGGRGLNVYDLMSYSGDIRPIPPIIIHRVKAGWATLTDITDADAGTIFSHLSNSNTGFIYRNVNNSAESFVIESRTSRTFQSGLSRWSSSDQGIMIFHEDNNMPSNNYEDMTPERHYRISLEQANGQYALENTSISVMPTCLYRSNNQTEFNSSSNPSSLWWDGTPSGFSIGNVSAVNEEMTFEITDPIPEMFTIETNINTGSQIVQLPANGNIQNGTTGISPTGGNNFGTIPEAGDKVFANSDGITYAIELSSASAWWLGIPWNTPYEGAGCTDCEISVIKSGTGTGEANGTIEPTGPASVYKNSRPNFKFLPDAGYQVKDVKVDGISKGQIYEYTFEPILENHTIEVEFEKATNLFYNLTVAGQNGPGSYIGSGEYLSGTSVSIQATPGDGYTFDHWMVYQGRFELSDPTQNPLDVVINSSGVILAVYNVQENSNLSIEAMGPGTGNVYGAGSFSTGTTTPISAVANPGSEFVKWEILSGTANIGSITSASTEITLFSDVSLRAYFSIGETVNLGMRIEGEGTASLSGAGAYTPGMSVHISATPDEGWAFVRWGIDDGGDAIIDDIDSSSTFVTLNGNTTIYAILQAGSGSCTGIPDYIDGNTYNAGDQVVNNGKKYEALVAGWASIGGPYEPGVGWAWEYAWTYIEDCQ